MSAAYLYDMRSQHVERAKESCVSSILGDHHSPGGQEGKVDSSILTRSAWGGVRSGDHCRDRVELTQHIFVLMRKQKPTVYGGSVHSNQNQLPLVNIRRHTYVFFGAILGFDYYPRYLVCITMDPRDSLFRQR